MSSATEPGTFKGPFDRRNSEIKVSLKGQFREKWIIVQLSMCTLNAFKKEIHAVSVRPFLFVQPFVMDDFSIPDKWGVLVKDIQSVTQGRGNVI